MQVRYRASLATISASVVASLAVLGLTCISNRKWLAGLETPVTRTKQTSEVVSNRDISPRSRSKRVNSSPLSGLSLPPRRPHLNGTFRPRGENM